MVALQTEAKRRSSIDLSSEKSHRGQRAGDETLDSLIESRRLNPTDGLREDRGPSIFQICLKWFKVATMKILIRDKIGAAETGFGIACMEEFGR